LFTSGTEVNSEIGDIGILFLLFIEGLNLSPERLKALGNFFSLGAIQLLLSVAFIYFGLFYIGPFLLPIVQDVRVPLDPEVFSLIEKPVVAFSIASAGALSSSAFVLPILKEKGWDKRADGIAALAILLLQDLAVAPMLIILPLIAEYNRGGGASATQDPFMLGLLVAKATIIFGVVLGVASVVLRRIFQVVARFGSAQTFVAASLLVAAGMGIIADDLGLSATTGAFAAGVLLAESGYRAQIEADIKPFEGLLLGVFFVSAGASLDPITVIEQWPTLLIGISIFIAVKFGIVYAASDFALKLSKADAVRVAFLLAGGGEFAFVVFKLAKNLDVLPQNLFELLTASVIISMSVTPLLGELATWASERIEKQEQANNQLNEKKFEDYDVILADEARIREAFTAFDNDGSGSISVKELQQILKKPGTVDRMLSEEEVRAIITRFDKSGDGELQYDEFAALWTAKRRQATKSFNDVENKTTGNIKNAVVVCGYGEVAQQLCAAIGVPYVAFSQNPSRISQGVLNGATVVYGNGAAPSIIKSVGVVEPSAIVVVYATESRCLEATLRLREAFPKTPIYVRADRLNQVAELTQAGATKVVVETRKVAEAFRRLVGLEGAVKERMIQALSKEMDIPYSEGELTELAFVCDMTPQELAELYELFATSLCRNETGQVQLAELRDELMRRRTIPLDDTTLKSWMGSEEFLSKWVTSEAEATWISFPEFVRFAAGKL
jgi:Kef-type K+ transport system membrane component KefB/Ca2+-binding EF-hand superfamily protein